MVAGLIKTAWHGRRAWLKINKEYSLEAKDVVIIIPDDDCELNVCAVKHMQQYLKTKNHNYAALIIADYGTVYETNNLSGVVSIITPAKIVEQILCYYRLTYFRRLVVVSLKEPYGSRGLLMKESVDMDYMVNNYIYRL